MEGSGQIIIDMAVIVPAINLIINGLQIWLLAKIIKMLHEARESRDRVHTRMDSMKKDLQGEATRVFREQIKDALGDSARR